MSSQIDHLLNETRRFAPSAAFAQSAIGRAELYQRAADDREDFWAEQARELHWHTPFTEVLDWSTPPFAKWFADGALNVAYNCLDRHVEAAARRAARRRMQRPDAHVPQPVPVDTRDSTAGRECHVLFA